jgi:hypothetical protein
MIPCAIDSLVVDGGCLVGLQQQQQRDKDTKASTGNDSMKGKNGKELEDEANSQQPRQRRT